MTARNLLLSLVACTANPVLPQLSLLDPGFGQGGQVLPQLSALGPDKAGGVALLPDGRILVAARRGANDPALVAMRLLPTGAFDNSFSGNGIAPVPVGQYGEGRAIAALPDGSVYLAGNAYFDGSFNDLAVARLTPEGELDPAFADAGVFVYPNPGAQDVVERVVPLADGRVQLGGRFDGALSAMMAVRLTAAGALDGTFGNAGIFRTTDTTGESATTMLVRTSGEVVLGGAWQNDLPTGDLAVLQLTADGEPDAAFAGNGLFHPDVPGSTGDVMWMKEVGDGRLWIAGQRFLPGGAVLHHYIGRLTSSGEWDDSFGTDGRVTVTVDAPWVADLRDVVQRPDGRFVLAFNAVNNADGSTALVVLRLLADGALDTGFGEGGSVLMPCPGQACGLDAIALQPDNKVVAVGYWVDGGTTRALVQRWLPEAYQVGINERPEDAGAKPYPMPCTTELVVPWPGGAGVVRVAWSDAQGRVVAEEAMRTMEQGTALRLGVPAGLSTGTYAVRLTGGEQVRMHRVQVVR